jgi:hypothetical protein
MASRLSLSNGSSAEHVGAVNSWFTGITNAANLGNIDSTVGPSIRDVAELYVGGDPISWDNAIDSGVVPTVDQVGIYTVSSDQVITANLNASYECRRNASLITSEGKIQLAISENNGYGPATDARWCIYAPSEDFNIQVFVQEYTSTDPGDVMAGNNVDNLLELTKRLPAFTGQVGPTNLNGTANVDLYGQTGIFKMGCLVTWESGTTGGEAVYVGPGI